MSDDIVIRLRESDGYAPLSPTDNVRGLTVDTALMKEAADEIQRLRELADNLAYHLQGYVCHCNMSKCKCGYDDVMDEYNEVRGE